MLVGGPDVRLLDTFFVDDFGYMRVYIFVCQQQFALATRRTGVSRKWRSKLTVRSRRCLIEPLKTSGAVCSLSKLTALMQNSGRTKSMGGVARGAAAIGCDVKRRYLRPYGLSTPRRDLACRSSPRPVAVSRQAADRCSCSRLISLTPARQILWWFCRSLQPSERSPYM